VKVCPKPKPKCPEDKSKCGCNTCDPELQEDCPDKGNPARCCQGCIDIEEEGDFDAP
jgi:hypothetical protein